MAEQIKIKGSKESRIIAAILTILFYWIVFSLVVKVVGNIFGQNLTEATQSESSESQELEQFPNPERGPTFCKKETIKKYGIKGDMAFFCGCYCGALLEDSDIFGNCLENCWKNFETIWADLFLEN